MEVLIRASPDLRVRLLFLMEWRAGLRISEALTLEARDLSLEGEPPASTSARGREASPGSCRNTPS